MASLPVHHDAVAAGLPPRGVGRSEEEEEEAARMARIAARAEQRALERQLAAAAAAHAASNHAKSGGVDALPMHVAHGGLEASASAAHPPMKVAYVAKKDRAAVALEALEAKRAAVQAQREAEAAERGAMYAGGPSSEPSAAASHGRGDGGGDGGRRGGPSPPPPVPRGYDGGVDHGDDRGSGRRGEWSDRGRYDGRGRYDAPRRDEGGWGDRDRYGRDGEGDRGGWNDRGRRGGDGGPPPPPRGGGDWRRGEEDRRRGGDARYEHDRYRDDRGDGWRWRDGRGGGDGRWGDGSGGGVGDRDRGGDSGRYDRMPPPGARPSASGPPGTSSAVPSTGASAARPTATTAPAGSTASAVSAAGTGVGAAMKPSMTMTGNGLPVYTVEGGAGVPISSQEELEEARRRYLGAKPERRRMLKPSERMQKMFNADWDAEEDTTDDVNPLYAHRFQASLLFGRGYQAGIDMKEQRKRSQLLEVLSRKRGVEGGGGDGGRGQDDVVAAGAGAGVEVEAGEAGGVTLAGLTRARDKLTASMEEKTIGVIGTHWSEKPLSAMTERDWRIMREDFDIRVKGGKPLNPLRSWDECDLHPSIRNAIDEMGYVQPSPIQRQAIPMGLAGRDLIGVAETGSGKTAAFLIPLLTYVLNQPPSARAAVGELGPLALVMAPTRELAQQIEGECRKLCKYAGVKSVSVVGGTSIQEQGFQLREGVDVIIGTPGRLIDALNQSYMVLHQCSYVVLDEADRMIDLGFEPQVTAVLEAMVGGSTAAAAASGDGDDAMVGGAGDGGGGGVTRRTTHMFTATMPPEVERLARKYMTSPATVKIGDEASGKNNRITQEVVFLPAENRKKGKLVEVLSRNLRPAIVFVNAKGLCDVVARDLSNEGFDCGVLHGGKAQEDREGALADFKAGAFGILIATDVAGRGLDIPDVAHVINYDMPSDVDRYSHRIGRTGRAGKTGVATTFVTESDKAVMPALREYLEATKQTIPPDVHRMASADARDMRPVTG